MFSGRGNGVVFFVFPFAKHFYVLKLMIALSGGTMEKKAQTSVCGPLWKPVTVVRTVFRGGPFYKNNDQSLGYFENGPRKSLGNRDDPLRKLSSDAVDRVQPQSLGALPYSCTKRNFLQQGVR